MTELMLAVLETLRAVLPPSAGPLDEDTQLYDRPGFDSLAVAGVLERLEDRLGMEMDPGLILPETFETPRTIAEALERSGALVRE
ncbi:MAG TPA: acyl carrier protein [Longimicrobium sp.]|nr:acyl carrier protein [Longimicrobium sp.]